MRGLVSALLMAVMVILSVAGDSGAWEQAASDSLWGAEVRADLLENPLEPPGTSSPRATLQSFLDSMNRSHRVLMAAHSQNLETREIFTPKPVKAMGQQAERLLERGVYCLDLSSVPTSFRKRAGYELALMLKEVLDRIDVPPLDQVPDEDALKLTAAESGSASPLRWRIPRTDIVIARVESGPRQGEYLFSAGTLGRLGSYYSAVSNLPYKTVGYTSDGFYEFYARSPGWLLPPAWNRWLPGWSSRTVLSLTIWQWVAWSLSWALWVAFASVSYRQLILRQGPPGAARYRRMALFCLGNILFLAVVHVTLSDLANISGPVFLVTRMVVTPIWWLLLGALIIFVLRGLAETIIASPRIDPDGIQASYFRALFSVLGFIGGGAAVIVGLSRLGVSLVPLLTGLGIGGLAVALAARPTLESLIGSFTIFADNPYRVGERLNILGQIGTVESIGLRSTRIRLLTGHLASIPNDKMAAAEIENIGRRPHIRRNFNITITYDTPPERIRRAVDIITEILSLPGKNGPGVDVPTHPNEAINRPGFEPRVYFNEFNSDSLNIYVSYWYHPPDYWQFMEHAHWVNLQIAERFGAEGIDFAFPTRTLHLAGDRKRPLEIGHRQIVRDEDV